MADNLKSETNRQILEANFVKKRAFTATKRATLLSEIMSSLSARRFENSMSHWPEPQYTLGDPEFVHAIGAVAINFNNLEHILLQFFAIFCKLPPNASTLLFMKTNNELRVSTIRSCLVECLESDEVIESVEYFLSGFMACAENRNIIMHASNQAVVFHGEKITYENYLEKSKRQNPTEMNLYKISVSEMRIIADSIWEYGHFGSELLVHIAYKNVDFIPDHLRWMLPELPSKPNKPSVLKPQVFADSDAF